MILRAAALLLLLTAPAFAETKGDCGTLLLPRPEDISGFNPEFAASLYQAQAASLMFQQLVWVNRYYKIDWPRSLASAITSPDQGTTYDVTLRSWHWSDGVPVTTADVAYTLDLIRKLGVYYTGYGGGGMPDIIKTFKIIDPTHFEIVLTHQVNPTWFIYNGLPLLAPVPAHQWSHYTPDQIYQAQSDPAFFQVVDGVARVQRVDFGRDIIFLPNPSYEGPKPHFSRLVFKFMHSAGGAVQSVESGELDLANLPEELWGSRDSLDGVYLYNFNGVSIGGILLNYHNPDVAFFHDVRVRQAMQDALDQHAMINLLYHGAGDVDYGPIPINPPEFLSPAMRAGKYPVGFDLAKARALLKQAGFTPGPDGIMQKDGKRLSFTIIFARDEEEQDIEVIQSMEQKAGIEIKTRFMSGDAENALLTDPASTAWEATEEGYPTGMFPSGEGMLQTGAYGNFGGYSDKTMDALINDSVTKPGLDALFAYEDYATAQQPMIFLPGEDQTWLVSNRLRGVSDFEDIFYQLAPDQLYCTEAPP
jgi:peptide/nickel transport system substrate-binding protein